MVDMIQTAAVGKIGGVVGLIDKKTLIAIEGALLLYLGLA